MKIKLTCNTIGDGTAANPYRPEFVDDHKTKWTHSTGAYSRDGESTEIEVELEDDKVGKPGRKTAEEKLALLKADAKYKDGIKDDEAENKKK